MKNSNSSVISFCLLALVAFAGEALAITSVLTFDDLPSPGVSGLPVPGGYGGLQWQNFYYEDGAHQIPSGYQTGRAGRLECDHCS